MQGFKFTKAGSVVDAIRAGGMSLTAQQGATVRYIAGGTILIDLMKLNVETPEVLVDISRLPLDRVERTPEGGVRIGSMVRNSDLAHHPLIQKQYQVLSEALLAGASAQLLNMASTGGNLLQRTRCMYFRATVWACNKRVPGSGCSAIQGSNRMLAILGSSEHCIATKPGAMPHQETVLEPGDLITHVTLPPPAPESRSHYLKLRDRASYEFAIASAAIVTALRSGRITFVRIAPGGVGTIPWRAKEAEAMLLGQEPTRENFRHAAEASHPAARQSADAERLQDRACQALHGARACPGHTARLRRSHDAV